MATVFEVFLQERKDAADVHVGSVRARDPQEALLVAKEVYARRERCVRLSVVPRECITTTAPQDEDLFGFALHKTYRTPGYFTELDKASREAKET